MDRESASEFKSQFIARTAFARDATGMSQEKMAEALGLTQGVYSKYESRTPLPHNLVLQFCALCNVTPAWLYTAVVPMAGKAPRRRRAAG